MLTGSTGSDYLLSNHVASYGFLDGGLFPRPPPDGFPVVLGPLSGRGRGGRGLGGVFVDCLAMVCLLKQSVDQRPAVAGDLKFS